jgi:hypothetical protein
MAIAPNEATAKKTLIAVCMVAALSTRSVCCKPVAAKLCLVLLAFG